jgi:hypothetical protein
MVNYNKYDNYFGHCPLSWGFPNTFHKLECTPQKECLNHWMLKEALASVHIPPMTNYQQEIRIQKLPIKITGIMVYLKNSDGLQ